MMNLLNTLTFRIFVLVVTPFMFLFFARDRPRDFFKGYLAFFLHKNRSLISYNPTTSENDGYFQIKLNNREALYIRTWNISIGRSDDIYWENF